MQRTINRRDRAELVSVLAVVLSVIGCGDQRERGSSRTGADATPVVSPSPTSVTPAVTPTLQLRTAMQQLLQGNAATSPQPTWFSAATAEALRTVAVDSAGHATVDFEDLRALIPNASSSAGSTMLLDELNATVFGVVAVRSVDYLIEGRCERFWEWLQRACQTVRRPD